MWVQPTEEESNLGYEKLKEFYKQMWDLDDVFEKEIAPYVRGEHRKHLILNNLNVIRCHCRRLLEKQGKWPNVEEDLDIYETFNREQPSEEEINKMELEVQAYYRDFMPMYRKYAGTDKLAHHINKYIDTHKIIRKDDFRFTLISLWLQHRELYLFRKGIEWEAEDVFKKSNKLPKSIMDKVL